ncbi:MAG TPA: DNA cytosine methyltransferase [Candidatus Hydrogenedentes bacterium]|nr:DNA cytosine methyltransferase [Candidatus Hydrogenedentota bacterium]HOV72931.1 DNA cytosine methyltransferase [Candidatus Hydrogenedentota bacterium]
MSGQYKFYEFFSGGGMARLGLGGHWDCVFANDVCAKKAEAYRKAFGSTSELVVRDIRSIDPRQLPDGAILAWASFPCQDLSLAGKGRGLAGDRSSTFWPFLDLILAKKMASEVPLLAIENVVGAITSNYGRDFAAILGALRTGGYRYGALVIDARYFVPQSRPRLFIVAVGQSVNIPCDLLQDGPLEPWHKPSLIQACAALPKPVQDGLLWWRLPYPDGKPLRLSEVLQDDPAGVRWDTPSYTESLLNMMSPANIQKVREAQATGRRMVGTLYRRTRLDKDNGHRQRAEVRFDQISGCLRTPAGGSSRQTILIVEGNRIRSRLLSPREAARLMGVPDAYPLPDNYNDAYQLMGDGVVVPVVSWLNCHILLPLAKSLTREKVLRNGRKVA